MVAKRWRKVVALFTAVTVITASLLGGVRYASATADTTGTTDTGASGEAPTTGGSDAAGADGSESGESQQQVGDDGGVVQENAVQKLDKSQWITMKDYELVAENDIYKMYLYEPRLSIMLEEKATGKIIESTLSDEKDDANSNASWNAYMKSGIVLTIIERTQKGGQLDMVLSKPETKVTKAGDGKGFSAEIYFAQKKIGLTVNVTLDGDQLVVNVPDDSIKEEADEVYINTVSLFPMLGYSYLDDQEGYMLIPDGNGALVNLDNKEGRYVTGFSQMIYGSDDGFVEQDTKSYLWADENGEGGLDMLKDANQVIAPIFGMAHTKDQKGYLAIVEKGEKRATIEAQPNGAMVNYNRCFARFLLRDVYVQPLNNTNTGTSPQAERDRTHSDLQVRYLLLSGDNVNYSTMANKYRDYLLNNNMVAKRDVSYNTRVDFLGTEREKFLLGTTAVTMTTTDDVKRICNELQDGGVTSLLSVYKGWQKGGLYDLPIRKYKADGKIGGNSDLTKLVKDFADANYKIYLYDDALRLNPSTNLFNFNAIKKVNKRIFEEERWADVYKTFNYLTPDVSAEYLQDLAESVTDKGLSRIAVAGISDTMFSYSYKSNYYTRNDTADAYSKVLDGVAGSTELAMEQPNAYLWKNVGAFLDMPLGSSKYMYVDEEIPFMSMVLKGIIPMYSDYVNFEANKQEFFLQMVEAGVYPSFYLTAEDSSKMIYTNSADLYSTEYSTYKDSVIDYDKKLRVLGNALGDATIAKHEIMDNGVTVVTYSNGIKVYVNYSDEAQSVDGVTVGAMSYSYKAGEAE